MSPRHRQIGLSAIAALLLFLARLAAERPPGRTTATHGSHRVAPRMGLAIARVEPRSREQQFCSGRTSVCT